MPHRVRASLLPVLPSQLPTHGGDDYDKEAGKTLGYALIVCALLMTAPYVGQAASLATLIMAIVLVGGCCCAKDYNMAPSTRGYAKGILGAYFVSLIFGLALIGIAMSYVVSRADDWEDATEEEIKAEWTGNYWENFGDYGTAGGVVIVCGTLANLMVLVFACLFTFKR